MRILLHGYNTCCQNKSGGVQVRIRKIHDLLVRSAIDVDYFETFSSDLKQYDVLHIFSLTYENFPLICAAKNSGAKIVISTIEIVKREKLKDLIRKTILKLLHFNATIDDIIFNTANMADLLIAETPKEAKYICKRYKIPSERVKVIPNGVEDEFCNVVGEFNSNICGNRKYVLQVGRFDHNKNQISIIKALKKTKIDVVFIGGPGTTIREQEYYNDCIKEAKDYNNFHFLGWVDNGSEYLKSLYKNAEVLVVPSFYETFGLTILEGGMAGAKLVISKDLPILDYRVFDSCFKINPLDLSDIREKIITAFNAPKDIELKSKLASCFSWERIINDHINCYKNLV